MKQGQTIIPAMAFALLLAPVLAHAQAKTVRLWLSAPGPAIGSAQQLPLPTVTAYALDANGKRDEKTAIRAAFPKGGTFVMPAGTRVEIVSSLPVKGWTGPCAKDNPSPEPTLKCIVTLVGTRENQDQIYVSPVMR
jgi:hypothetical protein